MELCITYADRFKKHYKKLSDNEKNQFKNKLKIFVKILTTLLCALSALKEQIIFLSLVLIWIFGLYGFMKTQH